MEDSAVNRKPSALKLFVLLHWAAKYFKNFRILC